MGNIKQYWIRRIGGSVSLECSSGTAIQYGNAKNGPPEFDYGNKTDGAFSLSVTLVNDALQEQYLTIIDKFLDLVICEIQLDNWTITNEMIQEFADYCMKLPSAVCSPSETYSLLPKRPVWLNDLQNALAIK